VTEKALPEDPVDELLLDELPAEDPLELLEDPLAVLPWELADPEEPCEAARPANAAVAIAARTATDPVIRLTRRRLRSRSTPAAALLTCQWTRQV